MSKMNNRNSSCPAHMSDGRLFTIYTSSKQYNNYIKAVNGVTNNIDYKNWLQQNAEKIITDNQNYDQMTKTCNFVNNKGSESKKPLLCNDILAPNDVQRNDPGTEYYTIR